MKPAPFRLERPDSLGAVLDLLARYGDQCKLLAGGQSLIPVLNMRLARPEVLIDLGRVSELRGVIRTDSAWHLRSMTTQAEVERVPGLPRTVITAVRHIAHPQIRSRGTVGGSLAHMDPFAEWPAVALAFGAKLVLQSRRGSRAVSAKEFVVGPLTTCLEADEVLVEIQLPIRPGREAFAEIARRPGDFALAGVVLCWPHAQAPSLAVFGTGLAQTRLPRVEAALEEGLRAGRDLRGIAYEEIEATGDIHATGDYRRRATAFLIDRAVNDACVSS